MPWGQKHFKCFTYNKIQKSDSHHGLVWVAAKDIYWRYLRFTTLKNAFGQSTCVKWISIRENCQNNFKFFCFPSFPSQTKLFECVRNSQKKGTQCTVFWWAIYFVQCNIFFLHKPFTAFEVIWHQDSLEIGDFIYKLYKKVTTNVTFILFNALSSFYDWRKSK